MCSAQTVQIIIQLFLRTLRTYCVQLYPISWVINIPFFSFDHSLQSTLNVFISSVECIKGFIVFWYILKSFYDTVHSNIILRNLVPFNDFNSNSSIWFCYSSLFINACRSLSSFLCCYCCSSFCCCTHCSSILCCLSSLFFWWSIWTFNICTIIFRKSFIIGLQKFL